MEAKGVQATKGAFWSAIRKLTDDKSLLYSLTTRQADVAVLTRSAYQIVVTRPGNAFRNIKEVFCLGKFPPVLIVSTQGISPTQKVGIEAVLSVIHKDPAFKSIQFIFQSTGAKWLPIPKGFFDPFRQLYKKAMVKGWLAEFARI
jgi:hypothetical protein